ncbi:MAG: UvrB/UvrC motif-containing protein [Candidatus Omnitrophica bacterium]|nr:UvrB/UvrC motif-containing protein [Candidatus Omnitrophota bacterium]MDD5737862.1 UvrB/UvrC motif-containing protein [Candidatus Omnitrophota bacterium]
MLCQACGKNDATVEFTEIVNDEVKQLHLCDACAKKKGIEMEQHFSIADFLAGLSEPGTGVMKCDKCGMTFDEFQKIGRFGCTDCYLAFRENLRPLLKRIHGSTKHTGKSAQGRVRQGGQDNRPEISALKQRLQLAVDREEFEEAAKLRDRIRDLENKPGEKR